MSMRYFDAHCHIQFDQYAPDGAELIERMRAEDVAGIVVGVDYESSKKAIALAKNHEHLYAAVGLHPNRVTQESFDGDAFRALAAHPKVIAIGECGLDFFRPAEVNEEIKQSVSPSPPQSGRGIGGQTPGVLLDKDAASAAHIFNSAIHPRRKADGAFCPIPVKNAQKEVLQKHITLAAALDKPLIIHARPSAGTQDAYQELIVILKEAKIIHPNLRGDIHFFVGGVAEAKALIALDFTISFTAVITFARDYDEVIRTAPLASILSETDAPYLAPASRRGTRNDPLAVKDVVLKIADIRGEDPETVRLALLKNSQRMFSLPAIEIA